jgi:hypothetical protein
MHLLLYAMQLRGQKFVMRKSDKNPACSASHAEGVAISIFTVILVLAKPPKQFYVKKKRRIRWDNASRPTLPISQLWRNHKFALAAKMHRFNAFSSKNA